MKIPVISLADLAEPELPGALVTRVWSMLSDENYFLIDGVATALPGLDALWAAAKVYFGQSLEAKLAEHISLSTEHRGYVPMGEEGRSGDDADYKESYDCGWYGWREVKRPPGPMPSQPGFRIAIDAIRTQMGAVAASVARLFSALLDDRQDFLAERATDPPSQLRLLHYPGDRPHRVAVDWHTDYECFTLLAATDRGLEVRRLDGSVAEVPSSSDRIVVTGGDLLEVLTNGGLRAAVHRVRALDRERLSVAYFYALDWDCMVAPLERFVGLAGRHYPEISAGDHLLRRTNEGFKYRRAMREDAGHADTSEVESPYFYVRGFGD